MEALSRPFCRLLLSQTLLFISAQPIIESLMKGAVAVVIGGSWIYWFSKAMRWFTYTEEQGEQRRGTRALIYIAR